jgi:hypothetical protein
MSGRESRGLLRALAHEATGTPYAIQGGGFRVRSESILERHGALSEGALGAFVRPMDATWRACLSPAVSVAVEHFLTARAALVAAGGDALNTFEAREVEGFVGDNAEACANYATQYATLLDAAADGGALKTVEVGAVLAALDVAFWADDDGRVRRACLLPLHPLRIAAALAERALGVRPGDIPARLVLWHGAEQVLYPEGRPGYFWSEPRVGVSSEAIVAATRAGWQALVARSEVLPSEVNVVLLDVPNPTPAIETLLEAVAPTTSTARVQIARSDSAALVASQARNETDLPTRLQDAIAGGTALRLLLEPHPRALNELPRPHLLVAALTCSLGRRVGAADTGRLSMRYAGSARGDLAWIGASGVIGAASYERLVSSLGFETRPREWDAPGPPSAAAEVVAVACRARPPSEVGADVFIADDHVVAVFPARNVDRSATGPGLASDNLAANQADSVLNVSLAGGHGAAWARRAGVVFPPGVDGVVIFQRDAAIEGVARPDTGCVRAISVEGTSHSDAAEVEESAQSLAAALRGAVGSRLRHAAVAHMAWLEAGLRRSTLQWSAALSAFEQPGNWPIVVEAVLAREAAPRPEEQDADTRSGPTVAVPIADRAATDCATETEGLSPAAALLMAREALGAPDGVPLEGLMTIAARRLLERGASRESLVRRELAALFAPLGPLEPESGLAELAGDEIEDLVRIGDVARRSEIVGQATRKIVELGPARAIPLGESPSNFLILGATTARLPEALTQMVDARARARVIATPTARGDSTARALRLLGFKSLTFETWAEAPALVEASRLRADYLARPSLPFTPNGETDCLVDRRRDDFFQNRFCRGRELELCARAALVPARQEVTRWSDRYLCLFRNPETAGLDAIPVEGETARDQWLRLVAACAALAGAPLKARVFSNDVVLYFEPPSWVSRLLTAGRRCLDRRGGLAAATIPNDELRREVIECIASRLFVEVENC